MMKAKLEIYYDGKLLMEKTPSDKYDAATLANIYINAEGSFYLLQKFIAALTRICCEELGDEMNDMPEYKLDEILSEAIAFSNEVDRNGSLLQ